MTAKGAIPKRKCVVCRTLRPRNELLRLSSPQRDGRIVPNPQGRLSGKGYYVCRQGDCIAKLRTDKKMRKVFSARLSEETYTWLEQNAFAPEIDTLAESERSATSECVATS